MASTDEYTKTLGIQWNVPMDSFKITVPSSMQSESLTKRGLVSDVTKMFVVLHWVSPFTGKAKLLIELLWELKVDWDDPVPEDVLLSKIAIPRCYFDKEFQA